MDNRNKWSQHFSRILIFTLLIAPFTHTPTFAQTPPISDTTPPELTGLTFSPNEIDVTASEQTITATLQITDDLSGVSNVWVYFESQSGQRQYAYGQLISGSNLSGTWEVDVSFPQFSEAGNWSIDYVGISDRTRNYTYLYTDTLISRGFPTDLTVNSVEDTTPPEVVSVSFSPAVVDVTAAGQLVTVTLHLRDDLVGVDLDNDPGWNSYIYIYSPSSAQYHRVFGSDFSLISGDFLDGTWQASFTMPTHSEAGDWVVSYLYVYDKASNRVSLSGNSAQILVTDGLSVISGDQDLSPPQLGGLEITPGFITVTESGKELVFTLDVTDDKAGFAPTSNPRSPYSFLRVRSPSGGQTRWSTYFQSQSGTPQNGVYTTTVRMLQYAETGTWRVDYLRLADAAGNTSTLQYDDLLALGYEATFVVEQPSLNTDGNVSPAGGTVIDDTFPDRAIVSFPPGAVNESTSVAIDVFEDPLDIPLPTGFSAPGTRFVNIDLDPEPTTFPLPPPGITVTLPLIDPMPAGSQLFLYKVDPATGDLVPVVSVFSGVVVGTVAADGLSAIFTGVSGLSTVVGLIAQRPGDIDGDSDVDRDDLMSLLASRNSPASGPADPRDLDGDGTITVLDARQLVQLCDRPRCATE